MRLTAAGCATEGLASLPLPAPGVGSGGYTLTAVFSNALNLPANAKVKLAGADVGQLESMVARNYTAVTTLRIMDGVRLPRGSTAELRSATPLGDVFVAIKPPDPPIPDAPLLNDGDTIGLESTTAAATVESVLSSAAILVNGGAVRNFTNIINGLGKATGDQGQAFGELIRKTNRTARHARRAVRPDLDRADRDVASRRRNSTPRTDTLSELMAAAGPGHRDPGRPHHPDRPTSSCRSATPPRSCWQVPVDRGHRHQRPKRRSPTPTRSPGLERRRAEPRTPRCSRSTG